ncbi:T9SS type A sorting domain-containing protein [Pedobacter sp.]|uniref:T9SS type A sorting domain-containing protein n=1 Tax=Pedobacter sp. TaxID=1411316 RepID=UPI0031DDAA58
MNIFTKRNFFFLFLVLFSTTAVLAQVTVTRPTGGQNLSVERAVGGPLEQFTAIGDIVIADNAAADFTAGTNLLIRLTAPAGWQFEIGTATVIHAGPKLTASSITESTATYITVSYTATSTVSAGNSLTISGLRVKSTSKAVGIAGNITRTSIAGGGIIAGFGTNAIAATLSRAAGPFASLQVLLPGQTNSPGTATGRSNSTVATPVAGASLAVTVNATDYAFNIITSAPAHQVSLSTNNPYATLSAPVTLVSGTASFNAIFYRYSSGTTVNYTITASDDTNNAITANTSSNIRPTAGAFTKLLMIMPGETYDPGSVTGKTGTATAPTGNVAYSVNVSGVDAYWNRVNSTNSVAISATGVTNFTPPAAAALSATGRNFSLVFKTVGETPNVTATNNTDGTKTPYTQLLPAVAVGPFVKLQILFPGETAVPNTASGKTGTPTAQNAGVPFNVTVNAVDANWNVVSTVTDEVAIANALAADAATSVLPANANLVSGTGTFSVTLRRSATNHQLIASNITQPSILSNTSTSLTVNRGAFAKLLITLPGETYAPGTVTGKTGTSNPHPASGNLSVVVRAVDAYWNFVNTVTDVVLLTTTDPNGSFTTNNLALAAGTRTFTARLRTAANVHTITVNDVTDNTKTSYTTNPITVTGGAFAKLVLVLPGETAVEGLVAGKTGTPSSQVAGQPFNIFVKAADAYGNTVTTVNDVVAFTATSDVYAQLPPNTALVNGILNSSATYRIGSTSNNRRLTVSDVTDNTKTASQSPTFVVNIGPYAGLLIVLPGETYVAGSPLGKTGTPGNQGIGTAFNITVRAVDIAWNTVTSVNDQIGITSNDPLAVLPANAPLVNGIKTNFSVGLNSASTSATLTATSITDGTKTPYTTGAITVVGPSATTDYYRTAVLLGDWSNSSTWESSANNTTWQPATRTPTNAAKGVLIRNTHTVNIIGNVTVDDVLIESGAQVNINGGTLTINNNAATAIDFNVQGVLRNNARPIVINAGAALQVDNAGKYQHHFTTASGTIPTFLWAVGSICEVSGYTTFAGTVLGSGQTFSDFVWNSTGQTAASTATLDNAFSARNFTVTSTGAGALNVGAATVSGNFTQSAGTFVVNQSLNVGGNFALNGGTFTPGSSIITFDGTSAQGLSTTSTLLLPSVFFSNNGTKTLTSGNFSIPPTGVLTLNSGANLNANGHLTLMSNASSSATVANIHSGSSITGNVKVERFISGGDKNMYRTYRMLSSPIYDNGNASNRTYSFTQFIDDMIISGTGGSANGFDQTATNQAGAWTYNGTLSNPFVPLPNINTSIAVGKGAYIFYRGDKSNLANKTTPPFVDPESIVMTFDGVLNQRDVNVPLTSGYNLVGNPYASSIDWNSTGIVRNNLLNNVIRIWNPASRTYTTYDGTIGVPAGVASNIIPAGQGFFVQSNASGSLTFTEEAKVGSQAPALLMSTPNESNLIVQKLAVGPSSDFTLVNPRAELRMTLKNQGSLFEEETAVVFQSGKLAQYNASEDVSYIKEFSEQKVFLSSFSSDNRRLVINYMPEINENSLVKFDIDKLNGNGNYQLQVKYKDVPTGYLVKLHDSFLGTSTNMQNGGVHTFGIDVNNAASFGANRFSVSFENPTVLPVTYASFNVVKINQGVAVKWNTLAEVNNSKFLVERAGDDRRYMELHTELAKGNNSSYSFIDKTPLIGNNYYRLVQMDNNGTKNPTEPQVINYTGEVNGTLDIVGIFPNPVISSFTIKYNGSLKDNQQTLKIVNATGQVLLSKTIGKINLLEGQELDIASYASGLYIVEVYENGNQRVGQTKLVKQ